MREAVRTPATAGLILQLFIVYLSVVVKRTGKEWCVLACMCVCIATARCLTAHWRARVCV